LHLVERKVHIMFVDTSGALGYEHARDLQRAGALHRAVRFAGTSGSHGMRAFIARAQLGPVDNYRLR
jgi:hypothetical protein